MYPRFSPFQLKYHKKDKNKVVLINCNGDRALTFKLTDLKLDCTGTDFDLYDLTTYSTLFILGPDVLLKDL